MMNNQKESVKKYFDDIASDYLSACEEERQPSVRSYIFSSRKKYILEILDVGGIKVLDVGCGPAALTRELLERGCEVWGIDISGAMVDSANKKMEYLGFCCGFHFSVGDIEHLDFSDKSFDLVLCIGVLEYLKDDFLALKEISRVLKKGGEAIITVPNISSPLVLLDKFALSITRIIFRILSAVVKMPRSRLSFRQDITDRFYLPWALRRKLRKNGFVVTKTLFHAFRLATLNAVSPCLGLFFIKRCEFLNKTPFKWWGVNYILKAKKVV